MADRDDSDLFEDAPVWASAAGHWYPEYDEAE
jgi:hypothetical protein